MPAKKARIEASRAKMKFLRVAPRKVRLVADQIRGKTVAEAQHILKYVVKPSSAPHVDRLLKSAVANATQKEVAKPEELIIGDIQVDSGPIMKRYQPRAYGRASQIKKRMSHLTIVLMEK